MSQGWAFQFSVWFATCSGPRIQPKRVVKISSVQFAFIIWLGFGLLIRVQQFELQIRFGLLIWIGLLIQANFGYSNHYLKKKKVKHQMMKNICILKQKIQKFHMPF